MDNSQPNIKPELPRPKRRATTLPPSNETIETMNLRRPRRKMPRRRQPRLPVTMEYRLVSLFEE